MTRSFSCDMATRRVPDAAFSLKPVVTAWTVRFGAQHHTVGCAGDQAAAFEAMATISLFPGELIGRLDEMTEDALVDTLTLEEAAALLARMRRMYKAIRDILMLRRRGVHVTHTLQ